MKILIVGDSWGCGVWMPADRKHTKMFRIGRSELYSPALMHKGIEFFLSSRGYDVCNHSINGGANNDIFNALSNVSSLNEFDFIFIFFTNPLRDLCNNFPNAAFNLKDELLKEIAPLKPFIDATPKSLNFKDFVSISNILAEHYKNNLEKLPYKNNIYMIGGHSKISNCFDNSSNVKVLIPSLREYLYSDFKQSEVVYEFTLPKRMLAKFDLETLDKFQICANEYANLPNTQKEYFYPDGYHLNMLGHKILADYIHEFIQRTS